MDVAVLGGVMNVPSRLAAAVSLSSTYPRSSTNAYCQIGALSVLLNLFDIHLVIPYSTGSFVVHSYVVLSSRGALLLLGWRFVSF